MGLHRCNMPRSCAALGVARGGILAGRRGRLRSQAARPQRRGRSSAADYKSAAVAAASVVAKVVRDRLMRSLAAEYPDYGFEEHVGYATDRHREALRAHGPCAIHRLSFQGVGCPQLELWDERVAAGEGPGFGAEAGVSRGAGAGGEAGVRRIPATRSGAAVGAGLLLQESLSGPDRQATESNSSSPAAGPGSACAATSPASAAAGADRQQCLQSLRPQFPPGAGERRLDGVVLALAGWGCRRPS